jgi:acetolactate synthase-1/2/3 large subunit
MNAAERCAAFLRERGVRRAFGIPGSEAIELLEAMRRQGVDYVLTHHEAAAGFMAQATAQLTGVPGIAVVTRGPGAMNLYPAVATAQLDRRPFVAVSADHPPAGPAGPRDTHQRLPLVDIFGAVTKWAGRLSADTLDAQMAESWTCALSPRPGPVYWSFPAAEVEREVPAGAAPPPGRRPSTPPGKDCGVAADRLKAARRPLLMIGVGVQHRPELAGQLVALAERLGCPAIVTPQAKGWFPESHPLFAGTFGTYRDEMLHALMEEADLILAVGLDGVDFFKRWRTATPVVSVAEAGADDPTYRPVVASDGGLSAQLDELIGAARPGEWSTRAARAARDAVAELLVPRGATAPDGDGTCMPPQAAVEELRRAFPSDGILAVDVGSHKIVVVQGWRAERPNTFLCSNGLSPMGTGLPFAVAAALARPDLPVACVLGDGGFLMYAGELETVARLRLPIVLLLMVDDAMTSIRVKQLRRGYPTTGTDFSRPDYGGVAAGFGFGHARVADRRACRAALERALAAGRPFLVEAVVDPAEYDNTQ